MGSSQAAQVVTIVASGIAGLAVGSFLNVVVYRLPRRMSLARPPSRCPACGVRLSPVELVPVLSWVGLRGRCRHCHAPVSARYPLVELATGALCAATAGALGSLWPLAPVAVVVVCALGASVIDAEGAAVHPVVAAVAGAGAVLLVPVAALVLGPQRIAWGALGAALAALADLAADRDRGGQHRVRIVLLGSLGWTAGWLWPGGGPFAAAWIVVAAAAGGLGAVRRPAFAMLAAGSVVAVLGSALVGRP